MSYKVLYRKYRPTNFNDIIDQKFITDTLKESIINNKISHAYIFSGPKGTGKTSKAKVFAKAINCENPIDGEPCGKCESCINFDRSSDIIELDAASNNKVEDIREIVNNVKLSPSSSKYKIYIIDEVHMLTPSAANAFLLTLEEPPSHAIFILATTNPESLPQTILSRCQQFAFSKISKKALVDRLKYVLQQEKIDLKEDILREIADLSDGGLRDALSILDQLITLNKPIDAELLNEQFGVVSESVINNLTEAIVTKNADEINKSVDEVMKKLYPGMDGESLKERAASVDRLTKKSAANRKATGHSPLRKAKTGKSEANLEPSWTSLLKTWAALILVTSSKSRKKVFMKKF